jgi:hypothetical protein
MSVVLYATLAIVALLASAVIAYAQKSTLPAEQVLYSFQGLPDGAQPVGAVVFDSAGNLYGATTEGGSSSCISVAQCGTVYELSPPTSPGGAWTETVLYIFKGNAFNDGTSPDGGLVMDSAGNLYGTTTYGGSGNCVLLGTLMGCGTVYELSPPAQTGAAWSEKVIYSFPDAIHGYKPTGDLTFDSAGNLYGATEFGGGYGASCDPYYQYCGAIFELSPPQQPSGAWTEQVLYGFKGTARGALVGDGGAPNGGLVFDREGGLYGTTIDGGFAGGQCAGIGVGGPGCGTVFKLKRPRKGEAWAEEILYRFDEADGSHPWAGLALRGDYLYGSNLGTIFKLGSSAGASRTWSETILYTFNGSFDPAAAMVFDQSGNLYGTTEDGNPFYGLAFTLRAPGQDGQNWTFDVLHGFTSSPDGAQPAAKFTVGKGGGLYSTTQAGGTGSCNFNFNGCGVVFELRP